MGHLRFESHIRRAPFAAKAALLLAVAFVALIVGGACTRPKTKTVLRLAGDGAPSPEVLAELSWLTRAVGLSEIDRAERRGSVVAEFAPGIDEEEREALQAFLDELAADPPPVSEASFRLEITESDEMVLALAGLADAPKSYPLHLDLSGARLLQFHEYMRQLADKPVYGGVGPVYEDVKVRRCGYFIPFDDEVPPLSFKFPGDEIAKEVGSDRAGAAQLFQQMANLPALTVSHRIVSDDPAVTAATRGLQVQRFGTESGGTKHTIGVVWAREKQPSPGTITDEDLARVAEADRSWGFGRMGRLARGVEAAIELAETERRPPPNAEERVGWCPPKVRRADPAFARAFVFPDLAAWLSSAEVELGRR